MIYCDCCNLKKNNTNRDNRWSREQISETYRKIIQGSFSSTIRIIYRYLPLMRKSMMPLFPHSPRVFLICISYYTLSWNWIIKWRIWFIVYELFDSYEHTVIYIRNSYSWDYGFFEFIVIEIWNVSRIYYSITLVL